MHIPLQSYTVVQPPLMKIQSQGCIPLLRGKEDVIDRDAHKDVGFLEYCGTKGAHDRTVLLRYLNIVTQRASTDPRQLPSSYI